MVLARPGRKFAISRVRKHPRLSIPHTVISRPRPQIPAASRRPSAWMVAAFGITALGLMAAAGCIPPGTYKLLPCTESATPANLQSQVNAASPGAVICLDTGVYRGSVTFQRKTGVALRGQGPSTVISGGADGILVFDSQDLTFQDLRVAGGHPTGAYISNSKNIAIQGLEFAGSGVGVHFDSASTGTITSTRIYDSDTDGVLVRRGSDVTLNYALIFNNHGAGVSAVGGAGSITLEGNVISHNGGPGVFAGQVPCAPLPGGSLDVPGCYLGNPQSFVSGIRLTMRANTIQESGSTGVVLFPGTNAASRGNYFGANRMTGVFVWGATFDSEGDAFAWNEEHAVELRAYPSPGQSLLSATGSLRSDDVHDSTVLAASGKLGGGVLAQGARVDVTDSHIHGNRGIGISYVNGSTGSVLNTHVYDNRGSAICLHNAGAVQITGDALTGNASDTPGVCAETT